MVAALQQLKPQSAKFRAQFEFLSMDI